MKKAKRIVLANSLGYEFKPRISKRNKVIFAPKMKIGNKIIFQTDKEFVDKNDAIMYCLRQATKGIEEKENLEYLLQ